MGRAPMFGRGPPVDKSDRPLCDPTRFRYHGGPIARLVRRVAATQPAEGATRPETLRHTNGDAWWALESGSVRSPPKGCGAG
jgi:hypothetical protein